jgi:excisionase family DNA binding protein
MPQALAVDLDTAAQLLGCCKRTVERLRDEGKLRCLRIGRHWKCRVAEIHAFLKRQEAADSR